MPSHALLLNGRRIFPTPEHAISRIADGEHPVTVLIGAVLGGEEDPRAVEHLRGDILPRLLGTGDDDAED